MNLKNKKILITCGPTWVPIDDMRVISNKSSGSLGQYAAKQFAKENAKVTLLEGPVLDPIEKLKNIKVIKFQFYDELFDLIKAELKKKYDIVIHAAAVSDYKLSKNFSTKISSNKRFLNLRLIPTEKIINQIKNINPGVILIGFKLESDVTKSIALKKSKKLSRETHCDFAIINSLKNKKYKGYLVRSTDNETFFENSRNKIIHHLIKNLEIV